MTLGGKALSSRVGAREVIDLSARSASATVEGAYDRRSCAHEWSAMVD